MKTKTTYEASLEIPVPPKLLVYVKAVPAVEEGGAPESILFFTGLSSENMDEAKAVIHRFVNDVLAAERDPNGLEVEL